MQQSPFTNGSEVTPAVAILWAGTPRVQMDTLKMGLPYHPITVPGYIWVSPAKQTSAKGQLSSLIIQNAPSVKPTTTYHPINASQIVLMPVVPTVRSKMTATTSASAQAAHPAAMEVAPKARSCRLAKKHFTGHQERAATASATAALQLIIHMLGLPPGPPLGVAAAL